MIKIAEQTNISQKHCTKCNPHVITRVFWFCASSNESLFICKVWMSAFRVLIMNPIYIINGYSSLRKCRYKMVWNSKV